MFELIQLIHSIFSSRKRIPPWKISLALRTNQYPKFNMLGGSKKTDSQNIFLHMYFYVTNLWLGSGITV